jgi:hypothetical protein
MLILEAIGPRGEELAMVVGKEREIAVGWDSEFDSATFDADGIDETELEAVIVEELDAQDPEWRSHLQLVE